MDASNHSILSLKAIFLKLFVGLFILGVINGSVLAIIVSVVAVIAIIAKHTDEEIIKMIKF